MTIESGRRTVMALADGRVSIHAASFQRKGKASIDAALTRAEGKALASKPGAKVVGRVMLAKANNDRRLRDAWRVDALTGRVVIDLAAARELKAEEWAREGVELEQAIRKLVRKARILGARDTVERLNAALLQVDRVLDDLAGRVHSMTEAELASHRPAWPQLTDGAKR